MNQKLWGSCPVIWISGDSDPCDSQHKQGNDKQHGISVSRVRIQVIWIQCIWVRVRWSVCILVSSLSVKWVQLDDLEDSYKNVSECFLGDKPRAKCLQAWNHLASNKNTLKYLFLSPSYVWINWSTERSLPQITQPLNEVSEHSLNLCILLPLRLCSVERVTKAKTAAETNKILYKYIHIYHT